MLHKIVSKSQAFLSCQKGATAIEYGLIAAGISVAIAAVVFTFGDQLAALFTGMGADISQRGAGG